MLKAKTVLEIKKNERVYSFELAPDSPLGEVHDVLVEMKHYVVQRITEHQSKENQAKSTEVKDGGQSNSTC